MHEFLLPQKFELVFNVVTDTCMPVRRVRVCVRAVDADVHRPASFVTSLFAACRWWAARCCSYMTRAGGPACGWSTSPSAVAWPTPCRWTTVRHGHPETTRTATSSGWTTSCPYFSSWELPWRRTNEITMCLYCTIWRLVCRKTIQTTLYTRTNYAQGGPALKWKKGPSTCRRLHNMEACPKRSECNKVLFILHNMENFSYKKGNEKATFCPYSTIWKLSWSKGNERTTSCLYSTMLYLPYATSLKNTFWNDVLSVLHDQKLLWITLLETTHRLSLLHFLGASLKKMNETKLCLPVYSRFGSYSEKQQTRLGQRWLPHWAGQPPLGSFPNNTCVGSLSVQR